MLIATEVAEAEDGLRKDDFENFKEELADIVIRTCDLAGGLNIDLEAEIIKKKDDPVLKHCLLDSLHRLFAPHIKVNNHVRKNQNAPQR